MVSRRPTKQWTLVTHEAYFHSLRQVVSDQDRYALVTAIWQTLQKTNNPIEKAKPVPGRAGRFTIELEGYLVPFEVAVDANGHLVEDATKIRLLPIIRADVS